MHITTILSRRTREQSKTLTIDELKEQKEQNLKLAIQWMGIPEGNGQANKHWDAVHFYENLIEKKTAAVALGSIKTERKAKAARENGKKGGRPKK